MIIDMEVGTTTLTANLTSLHTGELDSFKIFAVHELLNDRENRRVDRKIVGGGMPIGAVGGRDDVMSQAGGGMGQAAVSGGYGTFNGNPLSMVRFAVSQSELAPQ